MAVERPNIARVRVEAQERLDLPDFDALQDLVDDASQLSLGALLGPGGGCLSPFRVTLTAAGPVLYMAPTTFQFYWSQRAGTSAVDGTGKAWRGGIVTFNPLNEGQQSQWDYTAYVAQAVYIYARPKVVDAAVDGRRKFTGGAAQSVSLKTRKRVVVELKFSALNPSDSTNSGWSPVAVINTWNGNTPVVTPLSVWDSWVAYQQAQQPGSVAQPSGPSVLNTLALSYLETGTDGGNVWKNFLGGAATERSYGLPALLMQMRTRMKRFLSKAGDEQWYTDPVRDFAQLNADLAAAEATVLALNARPYLLVSGYVKYDGNAQANSYALFNTPVLFAGYGGASPFGQITFTRLSIGVLSFTMPVSNPAPSVLQMNANPLDPTQFVNVYTSAGLPRIFIRGGDGVAADGGFFVQVWCR